MRSELSTHEAMTDHRVQKPATVGEICSLVNEHGDLHIDLAEFDLETGTDAVQVVDALKRHLEEGHRLVLQNSPQNLAHNLYRIGLLDHPLLTLEDTRSDEAYAG